MPSATTMAPMITARSSNNIPLANGGEVNPAKSDLLQSAPPMDPSNPAADGVVKTEASADLKPPADSSSDAKPKEGDAEPLKKIPPPRTASSSSLPAPTALLIQPNNVCKVIKGEIHNVLNVMRADPRYVSPLRFRTILETFALRFHF